MIQKIFKFLIYLLIFEILFLSSVVIYNNLFIKNNTINKSLNIVYDKKIIIKETNSISLINKYKGCSAFACAAIALNAYGYNTSIPDLLTYTEFDKANNNFVYKYTGNIYSKGVIYPDGLTLTINHFLSKKQNNKLKAENISGIQWKKLKQYLNTNLIICWFTQDYKAPILIQKIYDRYTLYDKSQTILLESIIDNKVIFYNPNKEQCLDEIDEQYFKEIWNKCGSLAVKI